MNFSHEGLRQQALIMFSTLQTMRYKLPPKLTPELDKEGERFIAPAAQGIRANTIFHKWIRETIKYNKTHKNMQLAILMFVIPDQCVASTLEKLDTLASQMMLVPLKDLKGVNLAHSKDLSDVECVYARVEIHITRDDDTKRCDVRILDPDLILPPSDNDLKTMVSRAHKETGIPRQVLQNMAEEFMKLPKESLHSFLTDVDMQKATEFELKLMRSCVVCHKYGYNLGKCSGCKVTYYCSNECQHKDWQKHKTTCKKE